MSTRTPSNAPAAISKLPMITGLVCFVVGAVMLLYAGFTTFKSAEQLGQAQQNLQQLESNWPRFSNNSQQVFVITKGFATSTVLLTRTNYRVKLALCGISLLAVAAGGVLLFSVRPRK